MAGSRSCTELEQEAGVHQERAEPARHATQGCHPPPVRSPSRYSMSACDAPAPRSAAEVRGVGGRLTEPELKGWNAALAGGDPSSGSRVADAGGCGPCRPLKLALGRARMGRGRCTAPLSASSAPASCCALMLCCFWPADADVRDCSAAIQEVSTAVTVSRV